MSILRSLSSSRGLRAFAGDMSVSAAHAIECNRFAATSGWFRFWSEIELDRFPSITALRLQAKAGGRLVTAMHHAVLASAVARNTIDNAVFFPLHSLQQFGVTRVMRVGHQIARAFPATNVPRRDRPG